MSLENPPALWLLVALPCTLLGLGLWGWFVRRDIAGVLSLSERFAARRHVQKYVLATAISVLLTGAIASPRLSTFSPAGASRAGQVALLVDVSASMAARAEPEGPSRLERAQALLARLVDRMAEAKDVRIGLFAFTSIARSHVPFVGREDYPYLQESIKRVLSVNSVPGQGTSLGRPILQTLDKFSDDGKAKLILVFSDGEPFIGLRRGMHDLEHGWIEDAIAKAREKNIRIVTVGIGEPEGAKIPIYDEAGHFTQQYATLEGGDLVSYLDAALLNDIASRGGGKYFSEQEPDGLAAYVEQNLSLEAPTGTVEQVENYHYVGYWLLVLALPLWLVLAKRHLLG